MRISVVHRIEMEAAMENGGGREAGDAAAGEGASASIDTRPGILLIGAPDVGKRTLLSRMLSIEFADTSDLSTGIPCQGWTIETKYYTADLSVWITHLHEGFSFGTLPIHKRLEALVMVFDMNDDASFFALQDWVAKTDIKKFEILLCIGNKADLVTDHHAHKEYRRRMQKNGESSSDPHPEYVDYGIDETEGSSLLGHEDTSFEIRKSYMDWCTHHNIEYIEACASNSDFDKCLSIDGDIQGVDRLFGALSAHMWPGMVLKSGNKIMTPSVIEEEEFSDESDYEIEYEILSHGSDEQLERIGEAVPSRMVDELSESQQGCEISETCRAINLPTDHPAAAVHKLSNDLFSKVGDKDEPNMVNGNTVEKQDGRGNGQTSESTSPSDDEAQELGSNFVNAIEIVGDEKHGFDDLENLMYEIHNIRANLRLMPDSQRREMAANLAMKMAAMFGDISDDDNV